MNYHEEFIEGMGGMDEIDSDEYEYNSLQNTDSYSPFGNPNDSPFSAQRFVLENSLIFFFEFLFKQMGLFFLQK